MSDKKEQDAGGSLDTQHDPEAFAHARQLAEAQAALSQAAQESSGDADRTLTPTLTRELLRGEPSKASPSDMTLVDQPGPDADYAGVPQTSAGITHPQVIAGRYEVVGLLGEGGMGFVYKALDRQLNELVALKMLRPDLLGHGGAVERFKREVKLARRVTHTHVARTYDLGQHENNYYLTMEFVEGESLADLLDREGALSLPRALEIGASMAMGLAAAHHAHVIHRDLKPANVLLDQSGRVLLSDFGIAGVDVLSSDADATGSPLGTPAYMSPEQLQGHHDIDMRADIYSLGLILYEMLGGQRAWVDENPFSLIYSRLSGTTPTPLRELRPELPAELFEIVASALVWEREERVQDAGIVAERLLHLGASHGVKPHTYPTPPPPTSRGAQLALGPPSTRATKEPRWKKLVHRASTPTQIGEKRVAVLPFRSGPEDSHLTEGLTDDLCDLLSMLSGVKVRSMRLVRGLATDTLSIEELAEKLQVDVLIEGSIRRMGERLVIPVRLLSAEDGYQMWARRFQCTVGDLFVISEQVAAAVADALTLQSKLTARLTTTNPEAIELYFRARQEQRKHWHGELSAAMALYNRALGMVPNDPLILVGAAVTHARGNFFQTGATPEALSEALSLAERAIAASPGRGEPYYALAQICYYKIEDTARAFDALCTALERLPDMPEANELMGRLLLEIGPLDAGVAFSERAMQLDPQLLNSRWDLMRGYALRGEWGQVNMLGDLPVEHSHDARVREIARLRLDMWRDGEPRWMGEKPKSFSINNPIVERAAGYLFELRRTGILPEDTSNIVENLKTMQAGVRWHLATLQIMVEALAFGDDIDGSLDVLRFLLDRGLLDLMWLRHCPLLRPLRQRPEYQALHKTLTARVEAIHQSV